MKFKSSHLGAMFAACAFASGVFAQARVPVVDLKPIDARATRTFGNIFGVGIIANGQVVVNDGVRRQLILLDSALVNARVVLDSVAVGGASYGPLPVPLIPHVGDSLLFVELSSGSLAVIDPFGKSARAIALPRASDMGPVISSPTTTDTRGNLIYRGYTPRPLRPGTATGTPLASAFLDTAPILRANFESRVVDTIARLKVLRPFMIFTAKDATGEVRNKTIVNPLISVDEWAMMPDGTLAVVRGGDYHVDWIAPTGAVSSSPKMPYDWKKVTDDEKRALIDSARKAEMKKDEDSRTAYVKARNSGDNTGPVAMASASGAATTERSVPQATPIVKPPQPLWIEFVPLDEIADYYPPIRTGAVKADLDNNLWILPTTSAQSVGGELVYDVVNKAQGLYKRVRVPAGKSIAGFGKSGVVYLMSRGANGEWSLERARVR